MIDGQRIIMVPEHMVDLVWVCHESLAHSGLYKCYWAVREDLSWNNMARKNKDILKICYDCQTKKSSNMPSQLVKIKISYYV